MINSKLSKILYMHTHTYIIAKYPYALLYKDYKNKTSTVIISNIPPIILVSVSF